MRDVLVVVSDLFFLTRIQSMAAQAGAPIESVTLAALHARCTTGAVELVIVDLHGAGDVMAAMRELKADAKTAAIPIVGFYSHVDGELRARALEAGVDHVLPRSAFTSRLPELLATPPRAQ